MGVHTCLDTSGFLGASYTDDMVDDIDLCLLDVKSGDEETYHKVTGGILQPTIDFGQRLAKAGKKIWVRFVLNIPYPLEDQKGPSAAMKQRVVEQFQSHGFTVY